MALSIELEQQINSIRTKISNNESLDSSEILKLLDDVSSEVSELDRINFEQADSLAFSRAQVNQQYGIIDALTEDFAAIYVIAVDNGMIVPVKQPEIIKNGEWKVNAGWTYAEAVESYVEDHVHPEDKLTLKEILEFSSMISILKSNPIYLHHFRVIRNGEIHYYYIKATRVCSSEDLDAIMIGIICEDESKEKEILKNMSETDIMTKLYNRGTGERKTREFVAQGQYGLFCMLDIDKFKSINDNFGHAVGDEVIIKVAHELKAAFRDEDIVFRLGGDEFAVFAPGIMSRRVGMKILRSFINRVQSLEIPSIGDRKIEVSIGAKLVSQEDTGFEMIYERTDEGVYISKKTVGNTITFYPDKKSIVAK